MYPGYKFRNITPIKAAEQYIGDSPTKSIPYHTVTGGIGILGVQFTNLVFLS
jgi:hypothetical protein